MPGWDKISRVFLDQGGSPATPGFAWAGHGNRIAVLHEDAANGHDLRIHEIDPAAGTIITKDVVPKYNFGGPAPLCCEWTPDGRHIAVVRAHVPCQLELHDPTVLSQIDRTTTLEDSHTVTGIVFRGNLIYGIDREVGQDGHFKAWDWDGARVMADVGQLMMNGKLAGNGQRVEDLSDHGYLMAFSDTQDSLIRFFDPMQMFIDNQASVARSGQVTSCIGGGHPEIAFIWLATCTDVGGPRAKTGVCSILNDNNQFVETCTLWCDYRDADATLRFGESLAGKGIGLQLDHNSQKPTTGENGPPDYYMHPDPDAADWHFEVKAGLAEAKDIGFKNPIAQERGLLSDCIPNSRHWRMTVQMRHGGTVISGVYWWFKDAGNFGHVYRTGNSYFLCILDNWVFVTMMGPLNCDGAQFPNTSWATWEIIRNGNMYSLYINGVGMCYGRRTSANANLSEYVAAGPLCNNTISPRWMRPRKYVPVGAEL